MKTLLGIYLLLSVAPLAMASTSGTTDRPVQAQGLANRIDEPDDHATIGNEPTNNDASSLALSGYARASVWGGTDAYPLNTLFAELALKPEFHHGKAFMSGDLRLRKGNSFGSPYQTIDIHLLTAGYRGKFLDLLVGYQQLEWGRTDGFNPTNYMQAYDYFYLTADPADQRNPNLALRTRLRLGNFTELDLAVMPYYLPSVYRYELFELGTNVGFTDPLLPAPAWRNGSIAGRINVELPGIGCSVSAFRGYDPYRGFQVASVDWTSGSPVITNQAVSYQKTSIGADLSVPAGALILKAEAAWNRTSRPNDEMYIPFSYWMYVAGTEAAIGSSTLIINYIGHHTPGFKALTVPTLGDPMNPLAQLAYANALIDYENRQFNRRIFHQFKSSNHAVSLTWLRRFAYDAVEAQVTAYYDITSGELLARPSVKWSVTDQLTVTLGANYMKGENKTLFSYSSELMNGGFAELRIHF